MTQRVSERTVTVCDLCNREHDGTQVFSMVTVQDQSDATGFREQITRDICDTCKGDLLELWNAYCQ